MVIKPFPNDSSKLEELADNSFKFHENDSKFSKQVENTVGKGEIAHYEQFLLFPLCFQKTCNADKQKPGLVWEKVKQSFQEDIVDISAVLVYKVHSNISHI